MRSFPVKWFLLLSLILLLPAVVVAQDKVSKKKKKQVAQEEFEELTLDTIEVIPFNPHLDYKPVPTRFFSLLHTKLELRPAISEKKLYGVATIDLTPHFFSQTNVILDAKGMEIKSVVMDGNPLDFNYDGFKLDIQLGRAFKRQDTLQLVIDYIAKPYELDSATIEVGRGIYFINPDESNPYKPTHVWTQGETEAASCWFPTFEATYQKTTQELYVTVEDKYTTFSNGLLLEQIKHSDGTRTDYWKQSLPHTPYLFVLVIGEYQKYSDKWRDIEVNYFTFPKYFKDIDKVFGRTPDMMEYFSNLLGVDYPWEKYDQIIMYDYTAGAMENTSASVFYELMLCDHRDLLDRDLGHDLIIAHELFHQWFGDLVTCENWSQLTLNESFANYSEQLWLEEWKGLDEAELHWLNDYNDYMNEFKTRKVEPIVQYYYDNPNAVFDRHRYDKGGRVLHGLRRYLGDDAFFASLKHFLSRYSFSSAEIHDLRMSFEAVTGEDLNWYFNQWWLAPGHPQVKISQTYHPDKKVLEVKLQQIQKKFERAEIPLHKIPVDIDIILESGKQSHRVWALRERESFEFNLDEAPLAVNVDPGKMQLWEREDQMSNGELLAIFSHSEKILDKVFVFNHLKTRQASPEVRSFMLQLLAHDNWYLRRSAISAIKTAEYDNKEEIKNTLVAIASGDTRSDVRKEALVKLGSDFKTDARLLALEILGQARDSSFSVLAKALEIVADSSLALAYPHAAAMDQFENQTITVAVAKIYADSALPSQIDFFERALFLQWANSYYSLNEAFFKYLSRADESVFERGIKLLENIIQHEETTRHVKMAQRTIKRLDEMKEGTGSGLLSPEKRAIMNQYKYLVH
jgi:aminopeptidase N